MVELPKIGHPLLDSISIAFLLTDAHSKILYTNPFTEHLFGYPRHDLEGQRIRILFLEEDLTYLLPNVIYLTLYRNGFDGEALLRQKNGAKIFIHLSTTSFKEEGEVFLTFSFHEIQRLKRLEREKWEMKHWANLGKMVEEIAHQVRNPIVSIGGYTQRLQRALSTSEKGGAYLNQILQETKRLETVFQRVEEYVLIPRPIFRREKIQEVVEKALETSSIKAREKGISFHLETETFEGDENFFIDKDLVVKSLSHILENSMESITRIPGGKKRGMIKVALDGNGENVGISISDKGEGISPKNLNHIFDPFFSTKPGRIGLGLTFVKRVVEEHGGKIRVESHLKKGTIFILTFPRDRRQQVRRELLF